MSRDLGDLAAIVVLSLDVPDDGSGRVEDVQEFHLYRQLRHETRLVHITEQVRDIGLFTLAVRPLVFMGTRAPLPTLTPRNKATYFTEGSTPFAFSASLPLLPLGHRKLALRHAWSTPTDHASGRRGHADCIGRLIGASSGPWFRPSPSRSGLRRLPRVLNSLRGGRSSFARVIRVL